MYHTLYPHRSSPFRPHFLYLYGSMLNLWLDFLNTLVYLTSVFEGSSLSRRSLKVYSFEQCRRHVYLLFPSRKSSGYLLQFRSSAVSSSFYLPHLKSLRVLPVLIVNLYLNYLSKESCFLSLLPVSFSGVSHPRSFVLRLYLLTVLKRNEPFYPRTDHSYFPLI